MGDPRFPRKQYESPSILWDKFRIIEERKLLTEYGLKNMRELWRANSNLRKVRREARKYLSLGDQGEVTASNLMNKLKRYGIINEDAKLNDLLSLSVKQFLDRRLQSQVYKKGLSLTSKQSRQMITHGFISLNGVRVSSPSRMVTVTEENQIGYYKKIDLRAGILEKEKIVIDQPKTEENKVDDKKADTKTTDTKESKVENKTEKPVKK